MVILCYYWQNIQYYTKKWKLLYNIAVAPFAGARIEIGCIVSHEHGDHASLPSRERGLKFFWKRENWKSNSRSLPSRERGLKSRNTIGICEISLSLPSRERGLKLLIIGFYRQRMGSLPSRERGLKWYDFQGVLELPESLPSRERGLKFISRRIRILRTMSLPSRERGLK